MAEDVYLGFLLFYGLQQFLASQMRAAWRDLIENPERWSVGNEHIKVVGDLIPVLLGR
jgi:hypothetical protein